MPVSACAVVGVASGHSASVSKIAMSSRTQTTAHAICLLDVFSEKTNIVRTSATVYAAGAQFMRR